MRNRPPSTSLARLAGVASLALAATIAALPGAATSGTRPHAQAKPAAATCGPGTLAGTRGGSAGSHRKRTSTACAAATVLTNAGATGQDFDDPAVVAATLRDASASPVAGASITFSLGTRSCVGVTDAGGTATCSLTPAQSAGFHPLTARFAGTADLLASSVTTPFLVTSEETTLAYTGDKLIGSGSAATLGGTLSEDGTAPIAGRAVSFTLGAGVSAQTCTATTDAAGAAACTIASVSQPPGAVVVAARFAGDDFYLPATAGITAILFAPPAGAGFAIGDGNAAPGTRVTFWGAQWWKLNTLSGGNGPASFKGFIDASGTAVPTCGGTWTSAPGNSSGPPATIAPYVAVVVSSSITKSGPTISGDVAHIVVVGTDPGYGPNPGHAGTGTVVGTVC